MAKALMNEAECFLLKNWGEARLLEESMQAVRSKYKEVYQQVVEEVTKMHPNLDCNVAYPTQFWESGCIGLGRKEWPQGDRDWPPGLWVWNLRLENLASEDAEQPYACIWVSNKSAKKCALDVGGARNDLMTTARKLLVPEELQQTDEGDQSTFPFPSKQELLDSLADEDGQKFVARFVTQFELMAKFIPALDKLFGVAP